jgi:hypothetical protein
LPFPTVTLTDDEVFVLPAASLATAVRVWVPLVAVVVFQVVEYGLEVSSEPKLLPSSLNWTPDTPVLSEAVAETATEEPETVEPADGALRDTVGAVVSVGEEPSATGPYVYWDGAQSTPWLPPKRKSSPPALVGAGKEGLQLDVNPVSPQDPEKLELQNILFDAE